MHAINRERGYLTIFNRVVVHTHSAACKWKMGISGAMPSIEQIQWG